MLPTSLILILVSGAQAASPAIEVQGHRGARAVISENSLPAFEYAWRQGVDVLEMDLAVTKDGKLVVSHDPRINRELCVGADGNPPPEPAPLIRDLELAQVQAYDCGSKRNSRFPEQKSASHRESGKTTRIPSLAEVFELVKKLESRRELQRTDVRFNIETKSFLDLTGGNHPMNPSAFAELWLATVKEHGMLKRSVLQSFDYRTLLAAKAREPKVVIAALSQDPEEDLAATARRLGAEIISPRWDMANVNAATVKKLHAMHVKVVPWTPNTPEAWGKLVAIGVDGLISDDPAKLIEFLRAR